MASANVQRRIDYRDLAVSPGVKVDPIAPYNHAFVFMTEQYSKGRIVNEAMIQVECEWMTRKAKWHPVQCEIFAAQCRVLDADIDAKEFKPPWMKQKSYQRRFGYENKEMHTGVIKYHNPPHLGLRDREVKNPKPYMFRVYLGPVLVCETQSVQTRDEYVAKMEAYANRKQKIVGRKQCVERWERKPDEMTIVRKKRRKARRKAARAAKVAVAESSVTT
jgi:hypothetical protein